MTQEVSIDFDADEVRQQPDEILDLAENIAKAKGIRVVVCIDEFQSVADYPEPLAFQRKLRSHWQRHQHVAYCLYGSKRHMMTDIFSNPNMPFYRFGDILALSKIDNEVWGEFICGRFEQTGKRITAGEARYLANCVDNHSFYVQQLAQLVWFRSDPVASIALVDEALSALKGQLSLLFVSLAETLTSRQLYLLQAVTAGETELTSQSTLRHYDLGTSANVVRMKETLQNRQLIDVVDGKAELLDPLFQLWLTENYFRR